MSLLQALNNLFVKSAKALVFAFSRLPMRVLFCFADAVYFLMYHVVRYRLKVVRENLKIAFPHYSKEQHRDIERRFYRHFSDYIFETIKGLTISKEELLRRMEIINPDLVNQFSEQGRQVFVYAGHLGNWEWFTSFAFYFHKSKIHAFYQPQDNKLVNDITVYSRSQYGITPVESQKGYRHIVACARRGEIITTLIIGDQSPHRSAQKYWINFFDHDTPFLVGPETIARKTNQVLVYPSFVGYKRGHYEVEMKLIEENPKNLDGRVLVERFAALLEDDIRRIPELWLWSHRRWKHKHENFPNE